MIRNLFLAFLTLVGVSLFAADAEARPRRVRRQTVIVRPPRAQTIIVAPGVRVRIRGR